MIQKTVHFVGASRVKFLSVPFFFKRTIVLTLAEQQKALAYADEAREVLRAFYQKSDSPNLIFANPLRWEVPQSALATYAFFLRGVVEGRTFRYGAIFHAVGIAAASLNHVEVLQWLIREGIPIHHLYYEGDSILSTALAYRHDALAEAFLRAFPRFKDCPTCAGVALVRCILQGSTRLFKTLVERGFPLSIEVCVGEWETSPLIAAVARGRHRITRYLLKHALTETNVCLPKKYANWKCNRGHWPLLVEAFEQYNREVLECCKAHGFLPPADDLRSFCQDTGIFGSLKCLQLAEAVFPELPWRELITTIRTKEDYYPRIANKVLSHYNLEPYEEEEYTDWEKDCHDWRYDVPTTEVEVYRCLTARPTEVLRLAKQTPELLRSFYRKEIESDFDLEPHLEYAFYLAKRSGVKIFTQEAVEALLEYSRRMDEEEEAEEARLGLPSQEESEEKVEREIDRFRRIAALQGDELREFLDQDDDVVLNYLIWFTMPMSLFLAEKSTVEALEMWMERGFGICDYDNTELWYPIHFANAEILDYLISEVGMHYHLRDVTSCDALGSAIRKKEVERVKVLMKHGYPLNARKCGNDYPLTYATLCGTKEMTRVLYEAGAKMLDRQGHVMPLPPWLTESQQ